MINHKIRANRNALTAVIGIVTASAFSLAHNAQASGTMDHSLEGVWTVTTTPRDCTTGTPFPGAAFEGLMTFHKDGTVSAWLQNAVIFVTRSPSLGLWQRDLGRNKYAFKFIHLRYDQSGFFIGKQDASGALKLKNNGNGFTTDSSPELFDANGNSEGVGCANAVGTRYDWDE
jgi:hypothetical protein